MGYRVVTSGSFVTGQVTIYLAIVTKLVTMMLHLVLTLEYDKR